jgi:hypothetical protein
MRGARVGEVGDARNVLRAHLLRDEEKVLAPTPLILRSHAELVEAWRLEGSKDRRTRGVIIA